MPMPDGSPVPPMPSPPCKLIVPSRGRPDRVLAKKGFEDLILVVSESQADAYREFNPELEIVTHPEEVEMPRPTRKWQWILDKFGTHFLIDDDATGMTSNCIEPKEKVKKFAPAQCTEMVYQLTDMAIDMKAYLYGYSMSGDPRNYHGQRPFRLSGMVYLSGCGIVAGSKLYYLDKISQESDFWLSLLNAYYHRRCLVDERFALTGEAFSGQGGSGETRTVDQEKAEYQLLRKYFGNSVTRKEDQERAKRRHRWQPRMDLPFK